MHRLKESEKQMCPGKGDILFSAMFQKVGKGLSMIAVFIAIILQLRSVTLQSSWVQSELEFMNISITVEAAIISRYKLGLNFSRSKEIKVIDPKIECIGWHLSGNRVSAGKRGNINWSDIWDIRTYKEHIRTVEIDQTAECDAIELSVGIKQHRSPLNARTLNLTSNSFRMHFGKFCFANI